MKPQLINSDKLKGARLCDLPLTTFQDLVWDTNRDVIKVITETFTNCGCKKCSLYEKYKASAEWIHKQSMVLLGVVVASLISSCYLSMANKAGKAILIPILFFVFGIGLIKSYVWFLDSSSIKKATKLDEENSRKSA